jgi:hypothetical protein
MVTIMLSCPRLGLRMPGDLDDVRDAYRELEQRYTLGEVVLVP